jgi:hypothetical protein
VIPFLFLVTQHLLVLASVFAENYRILFFFFFLDSYNSGVEEGWSSLGTSSEPRELQV